MALEPGHISIPDSCSLSCGQDDCLFTGDAADAILVSSGEKVACSDFVVRFPFTQQRRQDLLSVKIFLGSSTVSKKKPQEEEEEDVGLDLICRRNGEIVFFRGHSTKPDADALLRLSALLKPGRNQARYVLTCSSKKDSKATRTNLGVAHFSIYLWRATDKVIVSDIDGTITKSNVRGVLDTVVLERHLYAHQGVCEFLSAISGGEDSVDKSNVRILYLTSRPMSLAQSTRDFLFHLEQKDGCRLPPGPLFCHSGHLGQVLFSELVSKDVYKYKADLLLRQVVLPFAAVVGSSDQTHTPIVVGFGNNTADAMAYEMAGIHRNNIFIIDKQSAISCLDRIGETDSTGRKATNRYRRQEKMTAVRKRKDYQRLVGTMYKGYDDSKLLNDVQAKLLSPMEVIVTPHAAP